MGGSPYGTAYDSGKGEVFITNDNSPGIVYVISDATNTLVATVNVGLEPCNLAYDSGRGEVFVTICGSDSVSVISDATNKVIANISVGSEPVNVAYDSGKGEVFMANMASNTLSVISDATNTVVATLNMGSGPGAVEYDPGKGELFVINNGSPTISVISDATNTIVATVSSGSNVGNAVFDSGRGEVFVANYGSKTVSVISDATNTVVATVNVGNGPCGAAYDSSTGEVFVTNVGDRNVSVISDVNNTVVSTIAVGSSAFGAVYDSGKGEVFVANAGSGTVSVITVFASASISLSPSLGAVGTSVTITGSGFNVSHDLTVTYDGSTVGIMPTICTTDASGSISPGCILKVPSSTLGDHTVTVSDGTNNPAATFTVTLLRVTCDWSKLTVGQETYCKATVYESSTAAPTGNVTWSSSSPGMFSSTSCTLLVHKSYSYCRVMFKATAADSSAILTAKYVGDFKNPATEGAFNLVVKMKATTMVVSCAPRSVVAGSTRIITCKAWAIGYSPTGTVSWSQSGTGSVSFSSTTCTLISVSSRQAACSVTMTGATAGKVTLQATYSGDPNNQGSHRTAKLTIKP